jgi:hypothetical protein
MLKFTREAARPQIISLPAPQRREGIMQGILGIIRPAEQPERP